MKKNIIYLLLLGIIILGIIGVGCKPKVEYTIEHKINSIELQEVSKFSSKQINDEFQINEIIESLNIEKWKKIDKWDIKSIPSLYLVINSDISLGLFESDKDIIKVEKDKLTTFYKIPKNVYYKVLKYLD